MKVPLEDFFTKARKGLKIHFFRLPSPKRTPNEVWKRLQDKVKERVDRLRGIIAVIEEVTGVNYPRIEIIPFAVVHREIDMVFFGTQNWMPDIKRRQIIPVIWLTVPALLYADDDVLTCHLLHELLHYIDRTILGCTNEEKLRELMIDLERKMMVVRPEDYVKPRHELRMRDLAKRWVRDKKLLDLFLLYETRDYLKEKLSGDIIEKWIEKGLPTLGIKWLNKLFIDTVEDAIKSGIVKFTPIDPTILDEISTT